MRCVLSAICVFALGGCSAQTAHVSDAEVVARSQPVAAAFQTQLKAQLQAAMKAGGPIAAVEVCKHAAPAIAQMASEESGAKVSRISLLNRNPIGTVPSDLRDAYDQLVKEPTINGKPSHRVVHTGTGADARIHYLSAIPMQEKPCAACHGKSIAPAVAKAIDQDYPADKARGFSAGELRGAMDISWPVAAFDDKS